MFVRPSFMSFRKPSTDDASRLGVRQMRDYDESTGIALAEQEKPLFAV
jgi:hypothetical protein